MSEIERIAEGPVRTGYPDCHACGGWGHFTMGGTDKKIGCGNCQERRNYEGLERTRGDRWGVWTGSGRMSRPRMFYPTQEAAEQEARRLARKFPAQKFRVFHFVCEIRAKLQEASQP